MLALIVCMFVDSPLFSLYSLSLSCLMCFCLCACLWIALYSNIFGKCSVRCSAQNGLTLIYGLTNLFALRFVLEPGLKELCKLGNAVNTHKITAEHSRLCTEQLPVFSAIVVWILVSLPGFIGQLASRLHPGPAWKCLAGPVWFIQ